ncbi:hypothetical protein AANAER_2470 [Halarcobacter anaerophilus]|nr:hypothetical protein AANAER_2470 [Halarcobacter anaerophilus]
MRQIYNYKKVMNELHSKKVRTGSEETFTPIDYISDDNLKELRTKGITNFEPYIPLPSEIEKHNNFVQKIHDELIEKYPNDEFLKSLDKEENLEIFYSYDWYEKYIKKENYE